MDLQDLIQLGYDRKLTAFEVLIPALAKAYTVQPRTELKELVDSLSAWNLQSNVNSVAQNVAIRWAQALLPSIPKIRQFGGETDPVINFTQFASSASAELLLNALQQVKGNLEKQYGSWKMTWGELNRFQRISNSIMFDDQKTSLPVAFTSSAWGQLPSYTSKAFPGTKKWYGVNGNSFVCAVEFGNKVKAFSLLAGGQSGDVNSPHFFDQAEMYSKGKFKRISFYFSDVKKAAVKTYKP
jgi:acyl-homoserine lactone acylase PvdQ